MINMTWNCILKDYVIWNVKGVHHIFCIDLKIVSMAFLQMQCNLFLCSISMLKTPEPLLPCNFDNFGICRNFFYLFLNYPRIYTNIEQYRDNYCNKDPFSCIMTHIMTALFVCTCRWLIKLFPFCGSLVFWV